MLMQGLELLNPRPCATFTLLPIMERPTSHPPLPVEQVQRRNNSTVLPDIPVPTTTATTTCTQTVPVTTVPATTPMPSVTPPVPDVTAVLLPAAEVAVVNISRMTEWHRKKGVGTLKGLCLCNMWKPQVK